MVFLDFQGLEVATAFRGWPVATRKCLFIYRSRESLKKKVSCHRASHFKLWLLTKRTGWWLQSIWKICSSNWIISPCRGENKKYLKPPPRKSIMSESFIAPSFKSNRIHLKNPNTLPETNSSPLKIDHWNFGDSYWKPPFLGAMLVSGRVGGVWATKIMPQNTEGGWVWCQQNPSILRGSKYLVTGYM